MTPDVNLVQDDNLVSENLDLEPTSVVKFNRDTKTLVFSTNFTIINDKSLIEVFNNINNVELIVANLAVATKQYLEFVNDNIKSWEFGSIVQALSK